MVSRLLGHVSLVTATTFVLGPTLLIGPSAEAQSPLAVEVTESGQASYQAELIEFSDRGVKLRQTGQEREVPYVQLQKVKLVGRKPVQRPLQGVIVDLRDGSRLHAERVSGDGQILLCDAGPNKLQFAFKQVDRIQLRKLTAEQDKQWADMLEAPVSADTLILARAEDALDKIEGAVSKISADAIAFDFDGRQVDAPIAKLAGIRFFAAAVEAPQKLLVTIVDGQQNRWKAAGLSARTGQINLKLCGGATVDLPMLAPLEFDFSSGNTLYVATLTTLERASAPRLDLGLALPEVERLFGPRPVTAEVSEGGTGPTDIEFVGAGAATYRVPGGYTRLQGAIELTPAGKQFTPCRVAVMLENKLLWETVLQTPRQAQAIDLPVESERRLKLVVESKAHPPIGDLVRWKQLRLTK